MKLAEMSTVIEPLAPMAPSVTRKTPMVARTLLFLWAVLIACPMRHWPIDDSIDNTWMFALNYAAAHGLALGRDVVWTTGPLGYLVFPQNIGNNLAHALAFQCVVWLAMTAILMDLFYRAGISLRSLTFFTVYFSLSAPLYWFNYMGPENLLLAGALVLLVRARFQGGWGRYTAALVLAGIISLIKLTGGMLALGAIAGFLVDRMIRSRRGAWREVILALFVPLGTAGLGFWLFLPSWDAFFRYWAASAAITNNYSIAMSISGDPIEFGGALEVLIGLGALLFINAKHSRRNAWFFVSLLAIPIFMSFKHGFVRQDVHVVNFFFFIGLALGLISLAMPLDGKRSMIASLVLLNFGMVSLEYMVARVGIGDAVSEASGFRALSMLLDHSQPNRVSEEARVEPTMRAIIGDAPISSLSVVYSGALGDQLNLQLYPVVQRYAAFTPYLDGLSAAWVRERGPRFLLFDGHAIDDRHPWAETPAMWLEIYRWYNTRLLGSRNLLLERRESPRFGALKLARRVQIPLSSEIDLDRSFWTMQCGASAFGKLEKLLFRVPEVRMRMESLDGTHKSFRVIPEVLGSPMPGEGLPSDLVQFASFLQASPNPKPSVKRLAFEGAGLSAYKNCQVELLTPDGRLD